MRTFLFLLLFSAHFGIAFCQTLTPFPRRFTLENEMPPIKNQHNRYTCAAFSFLAVLEYEIQKKYGFSVNLSEEFLHYLVAEPETGYATISDCIYATNVNGALMESDLPYQFTYYAKGFPCEKFDTNRNLAPLYCYKHYAPPKNLLENRLHVKLSAANVSSPLKICREVATKNTPVLLWMPLVMCASAEKSGKFAYDTTNLNLHDEDNGHFVVVDGFDLDSNFFYVRNSFGKNWGNKGRASLDFNYYRKFKNQYAYSIRLDSMGILPLQKANYYNVDSIMLRNSNVKASIQKDSSIVVQILGKKPDFVRNQFHVESMIVTQKNTEQTKKIDPKSVISVKELGSMDTLAITVKHSITQNLKNNYFAKDSEVPFVLSFPKAKDYSVALNQALANNQNIFLLTRLIWHNDQKADELVQEYIVSLDKEFFMPKNG